MKKHIRFIIPLGGLVLIVIFVAGNKIGDYQKLGRNFLAAIGLQNGTSSQDIVSSTSRSAPGATSTPTLADALQQLQDQVQSLNNQMTDLRSEIEIADLRTVFTRTLKRGDTGDDVSKLQELLMRFPDLYSSETDVSSTVTGFDVSSTVTGFYGSLTRAAVMQFQSQAELQETGIFDPDTRGKFYELLRTLAQESTSTKFTPIDISSIADLNDSSISQNQNSAVANLNNSSGSQNQSSTDAQKDIAMLQDQISQLASDSTSTQANIADLQNQVSQLTLGLANVNQEIANLQGPSSPPPSSPSSPPQPPSPQPVPPAPPAISNIQTTNITRTSSTIMWTTDVLSTSEVHYSTDPTLSASKTTIISSSTMVINHAVVLRNLSSGTKYYYWVLSKGGNNAAASSTIQNFSTLF